MHNERENLYQPLEYVEYDISGNVFRAYYDADGKIVFVLDFTESDVKPNVLLVINPVGDRKWDDILMNDYGVDLETVRPKKDNKYQKLDIEYTGLAEYDDLINAHKSGTSVSIALDRLARFHDDAARRAAYERLDAAELIAERARETIEKTKTTISDLQSRLKMLRTKLATQRHEIGREPTKQSAAKILRTETQIDSANDKLGRAKKRLQKAQRRLANAEEDIEVANNILAILGKKDSEEAVMLPGRLEQTDVVAFAPVFKPIDTHDEAVLIENNEEPKADEMADDEVKPLFDTDPKILNDEIAFKPVDFSAPVVNKDADLPAVVEEEPLPMPMPEAALSPVSFAPVVDVPEHVQEPVVEAVDADVVPLSFTPPVATDVAEYVEEQPTVSPVLDSITSVSESAPQIDAELMPMIEVPQFADSQWNDEPVNNKGYQTVDDTPSQIPYEQISQEYMQPEVKSMSEIEPAPIDTGMRPVSPISGNERMAENVDAVVPERQKPAALYYFLLVILIVLSIFTLWFYQKSANKATPELGAQTVQETVVVEEGIPDGAVVADEQVETVAVQEEELVETVETVVPVQPVETVPVSVEVEPEPVPVVEPEPVQILPDVEAQPVPIIDLIEEAIAEPEVPEPTIAPAYVESPFLPAEEEKKPVIMSEEEILAKKPAYGVSQNEKMFVADEDYETDAPVEEEFTNDVVDESPVDDGFNTAADAQIIRSEVEVVNENLSDAENQFVTQEVFEETETVEGCADGAAPNADGCCSGEELRDLDGEYMCCAVGTDDCFPPMN